MASRSESDSIDDSDSDSCSRDSTRSPARPQAPFVHFGQRQRHQYFYLNAVEHKGYSDIYYRIVEMPPQSGPGRDSDDRRPALPTRPQPLLRFKSQSTSAIIIAITQAIGSQAGLRAFARSPAPGHRQSLAFVYSLNQCAYPAVVYKHRPTFSTEDVVEVILGSDRHFEEFFPPLHSHSHPTQHNRRDSHHNYQRGYREESDSSLRGMGPKENFDGRPSPYGPAQAAFANPKQQFFFKRVVPLETTDDSEQSDRWGEAWTAPEATSPGRADWRTNSIGVLSLPQFTATDVLWTSLRKEETEIFDGPIRTLVAGFGLKIAASSPVPSIQWSSNIHSKRLMCLVIGVNRVWTLHFAPGPPLPSDQSFALSA